MTNPTDNGEQPIAPDQPETPQPPAAPEPPATPEPPQPLDSQSVTPEPVAQPTTPPAADRTHPTTPIPPTADRAVPRYGQYASAGVAAAGYPQEGGPTAPGTGPTPQGPGAGFGPAATGAGFGPAATGRGAPPAPGAPATRPVEPAASGPRKKSTAVPVVAALAIGALIGGVSGAGVTLATTAGASQTREVGNADPGTITINNPDTATNVGAVAAKASPSVVTLSVTGGQGSGTGSGVVIDDEGHILTNTHVVTLDGAVGEPTVQVQTYDGRLLEATVVGTDPISDLAVIKVDPAADLPSIKFADSDELNVGDVAIAIGAPLGLSNTVTDGIVSALNRSITVASSAAPEAPTEDPQPDENSESPYDFWNFDIPGQHEQQQSAPASSISLSVIQTDASINPGNSGGALLNANGELIGINVAIASAGGQEAAGSIGVGFAIPSNLAQRVASEIIETGSASHGLLGATVGGVTDGSVLGAEIREVTAGGAADQAGLQAGDVVTSFNGVPITSPTDLTAQVRVLGAGDKAEIVWVRGGETNSAEVTVGELPQ